MADARGGRRRALRQTARDLQPARRSGQSFSAAGQQSLKTEERMKTGAAAQAGTPVFIVAEAEARAYFSVTVPCKGLPWKLPVRVRKKATIRSRSPWGTSRPAQ